MKYDLFTSDECLAEGIVAIADRAYMVDTTERPDVFQFFNMSEDDMRRVNDLIMLHENDIEIRNSKNDDYVWPSSSGCSLEQALDLV